jgi:citrate lyase subunit beta/citryl-CoA lyase
LATVDDAPQATHNQNGSRPLVLVALISTIPGVAAVEGVVRNQRASRADALIFELETGVIGEREEAREIVVHCLTEEDYGGRTRVVRINPMTHPESMADLAAAMRGRPDAILLAKADNAEEIRTLAARIDILEHVHGLPPTTEIWAMIESPSGVLNVDDIAKANPRLTTLCFGGGDYTDAIGTRMSLDSGDANDAGIEILYARSRIVAAGRAHGRTVLDVPALSTTDEGLVARHARRSRSLGFDGMIVLSPRQIPWVFAGFTPNPDEIARASAAVTAFDEATANGKGIVGVNGEMVSAPIASQYRRWLAIRDDVLRREP